MSIIKLFHLLFVFSWMGSLLFLTRFLAYVGREESYVRSRFILIARRIYLCADMPSMIAAIALGWILFFGNGVSFKAGWLHMKLTFAFLLIVIDPVVGYQLLFSSRRIYGGSGLFYTILHGLVALFLTGIFLIAIYILKVAV